MRRREFLGLGAGAMLATACSPWQAESGIRALGAAGDAAALDGYFHPLMAGFLRAARETAPGFAVCDFPQGARVASCLTPSGKTYVSVARVLPLLSAWLGAGREPRITEADGRQTDLREVAVEIYRNAFDPRHPHYWGKPPVNRATQRSVEAALVADALWRMRDLVLPALTTRERANVQEWLASCTVVPERANNHAWFTGINQAVRLRLAEAWPEFEGDEAWMLADLAALDALFEPGRDGWYSDSPTLPIYDYYNFWTFANFPLLWSRVIGERYPEWDERFRSRVKLFLERTPYFYAADGSHPWFGRSLLYRWSTLSPLVLGYQEGLWPHSAGLLRRIVRLHMEQHWAMGAFDPQLGKLRETLSADGTPEVREFYIDNGSPYWATLGMFFYSIPAADPFWTAPEEPLPVERQDYAVRFEGPRMLLVGTRASGQVRWLQARGVHRSVRYRDHYTKFVASSSFPFNIVQSAERAPWDQALVFRDRASGETAGRLGVLDGELLEDGVRTRWWTELNGIRIEVVSEVRVRGEFEARTHAVTLPAGLEGADFDVLEGSYALGLREDEAPEQRTGPGWLGLRSGRSGHLLVSWNRGGYERLQSAETFEETGRARVNIIHPRVAVATLAGRLAGERTRLASLHYASPRPLGLDQVLRQGRELASEWAPVSSTPLGEGGR